MPDIYYNEAKLCEVGKEWIARLKSAAVSSPRKRARLCLHLSSQDSIHQMVIVLHRSTYVRPHRHPGKIESMHLIEGSARVVIFDDCGTAIHQIDFGDNVFVFRMATAMWHSVIPSSEYVVMHEIVNGPFRVGDTEFASWSPMEDDVAGIQRYYQHLGE